MVIAKDAYTNRIVRTGVFHVREKESGRVLIMPRMTTFSLNHGLGANTEITEPDSLGRITKVANNFAEFKPVLTLNFTGRNLDLTALSINQQINQVNVDLRFPWRQQVLQNVYNAAPAGRLGNNILKDAITVGSYHDKDTLETFQLVQQNYDTFNPNLQKSFAIGPSFERRFSLDLVSGKHYIVLVPEANYDARGISEDEVGSLEIIGMCFNSAGHASIFIVYDCFINPEGGGISQDGNVTINFDIPSIDRCQPWNEYEVPGFEPYCQN